MNNLNSRGYISINTSLRLRKLVPKGNCCIMGTYFAGFRCVQCQVWHIYTRTTLQHPQTQGEKF